MKRMWTNEEIEYLKENIGEVNVNTMAKVLKRSTTAILLKANKLGYSVAYCGEKLSFNQLIKAVNPQAGTNYNHYLEKWTKLGLKIYLVKVRSTKQRMVKVDEFWRWAYKNKDILDFRNMEHYALGYEPSWVAEKIKQDKQKFLECKTRALYTKHEEALLLSYCQRGLSSLEIANRLCRSQESIKAKVLRLQSDHRPKNKRKYWKDNEIDILIREIEAGKTYDQVAKILNRSIGSVRRKYARIGEQNEISA